MAAEGDHPTVGLQSVAPVPIVPTVPVEPSELAQLVKRTSPPSGVNVITLGSPRNCHRFEGGTPGSAHIGHACTFTPLCNWPAVCPTLLLSALLTSESFAPLSVSQRTPSRPSHVYVSRLSTHLPTPLQSPPFHAPPPPLSGRGQLLLKQKLVG